MINSIGEIHNNAVLMVHTQAGEDEAVARISMLQLSTGLIANANLSLEADTTDEPFFDGLGNQIGTLAGNLKQHTLFD